MAIETIRRFLRLEAAGGILLVLASAVALACANIAGVADAYAALLATPVEIRIGALYLNKTLLLVINDGLMAVFFLLVALEIKREVLEGELSKPSQIALPGFAALGGVIAPALIYFAVNRTDEVALRGWAIPAATDIAFSLGVLALLGARVPTSMKVFLTTLAVLDDLAAIVIIAVFYTDQLGTAALLLALLALAALLVLNLLHVTSRAAYILLGVLLWLCVLKSGVHATLAGVALGLLFPFRGRGQGAPSPLHELEHTLHPWVAFGILPVFAFANAGVSFAGISAQDALGPVTLGIAGGLVFGKLVGVMGFSWLIIASGTARLPAGATWASMTGIALLCGIGFTMSLFIGTLAFADHAERFAAPVRIGVLGASVLSAAAGYFVLAATLPKRVATPG